MVDETKSLEGKELTERQKMLLGDLTELGFVPLAMTYPGSHIPKNPNQPDTILTCIISINDKIEIKYFHKENVDLEPDDSGDLKKVTDVWDFLNKSGNEEKTPSGWQEYKLPTADSKDRGGLDARIKFGAKPARIYFLMLLDNWDFATLKQDAITPKLPVTNFYSGYHVIADPIVIGQNRKRNDYTTKIFSIYNHNPFPHANHEYNLHCLVKIGDMDVPITIDPKFENP